jgi:hypothetical protein
MQSTGEVTMDIKTIKFPYTGTQILGAVLVVNTVLAGGATQLTNLFGEAMAGHILAVCTLGTGIAGGFLMRLGSMANQFQNVRALGGVDRILVNGQVPPEIAALAMDPTQGKISPASNAVAAVTATAAKAAILLAILLSGLLMWPADGMAQAKLKPLKPPQITGNIAADAKANFGAAQSVVTGKPVADPAPIDVWKAIMTVALPDLVYSSALSGSAGTPASKIRKQCWEALITANKQAQGTGLVDANNVALAKPDPHFFTDVELLAETIDNLSPSGPLLTSCAGAAEMAKMSVLQFINTAVTGAAGFAAMGL